ncbi:Uncharacterised protein [Mycobacteroides abscessus subsp. abscessus]|uniref:Uncharacterized protein n=1 Tax=Mycobacteroides abscessus subsp. bolletii TaxID=319705 RepID=A0A9Q7SH58_9MYCO|nr:Uncharacterised protein [Mycobacteroides abscessus subsp. bolletii]SIE10883.1 Uncharacterised protein [Mycobacteroides abscessus subsp. abscessus]SHU74104.1 Uncharacterised protein [Mycobacteroides abscessus subsp. bolletii]SHX82969.1 Uncharacterised protein [Mycobacteroides abscessus subsp. bolletii]SIG01655.1 Uncharacterised protein [Mycobacteroides abscessus subsp. abscessus]
MSETEPPLTPVERLAIAALYAHLAVSQNRPSLGRLSSERACYADLNICSPESLSHKKIPATRVREGIETC